MPITFSQQLLCDKLLLAVTNEQKSNFTDEFNLKTYNNLPTMIYFENIVCESLLFLEITLGRWTNHL